MASAEAPRGLCQAIGDFWRGPQFRPHGGNSQNSKVRCRVAAGGSFVIGLGRRSKLMRLPEGLAPPVQPFDDFIR